MSDAESQRMHLESLWTINLSTSFCSYVYFKWWSGLLSSGY